MDSFYKCEPSLQTSGFIICKNEGGKAPRPCRVAEKSAPRWARLSRSGHPLTQSEVLATVLTTRRPTATYHLLSFTPTCLRYLSVGTDSDREAKKRREKLHHRIIESSKFDISKNCYNFVTPTDDLSQATACVPPSSTPVGKS